MVLSVCGYYFRWWWCEEIGGTPFLDNGYTVFGEVTKGLQIIDKICSVKTDRGDQPISAITILSARIIK